VGFLSKIAAYVVQNLLTKLIGAVVDFVKKKAIEREENKVIDQEVQTVESLRAQIMEIKKRGENVPKELEDKLRLALARLNSGL